MHYTYQSSNQYQLWEGRMSAVDKKEVDGDISFYQQSYLSINPLIFNILYQKQMLQKEKFNVKFPGRKVDMHNQIAIALDNTFIIDARFERQGQGMPTIRKIIHQNAEGKELLQLYNDCTSDKKIYQSFQMMNDHEVIIFLKQFQEVEIQVINLQSRHISRSFLDNRKIKQKLKMQIKWYLKDAYLFPQTQLITLVIKEDYNDRYTRLLYYKYNQLQEGKAKPVKKYIFQGQKLGTNKLNSCSKLAIWKLDGFNIIFLTVINQKQEVSTLRNIRCSWFDSKQKKNIDSDFQNSQMELIECRLGLYFIKIYHINYFLHTSDKKYGFLDTSKEAKILEEVLISTKGINQARMRFQPLNNIFLIYGLFYKSIHQNTTSPTYFFDFQKQAMFLADHQQAGVKCQLEQFFFPDWDKNTFVRTQQKSRPADEIEVIVTKTFPLKEVSLHMILHLNEDFNDDLLHDAISMLCEI